MRLRHLFAKVAVFGRYLARSTGLCPPDVGAAGSTSAIATAIGPRSTHSVPLVGCAIEPSPTGSSPGFARLRKAIDDLEEGLPPVEKSPATQARDEAGETNPDLDCDDAGESEISTSGTAQRRLHPLAHFARTALAAALKGPALSALRRAQSVVIVIIVPSPAWVEPIADALRRYRNPRSMRIITAASKPRRSTSVASDSPDQAAAKLVSEGQGVVAVTSNAEYLAPCLLAAAEYSVTIPPPGPRLVAKIVRAWVEQEAAIKQGRNPTRLGDNQKARTSNKAPIDATRGGERRRKRRLAPLTSNHVVGLDLPDLAAALRLGATEDECVARLARASKARNGLVGVPEMDVPPLASLTGYGEAHAWARGIVRDIARVRRGEMKAELLEGAVFFGPPGTGKTLLAKATAAAACVPYLGSSVGSWFADSPGHLDSVIKEVDRFCDGLLLGARSAGTAIGFLDELDALPNRARLSDRGADWWLPVINHSLMRFEGVRRAGCILIAATNDISRIDAALLRPGRFDRQFYVPAPDEKGRLGILGLLLENDLPGADLTIAARLSEGQTGAVLAGHVRAARRRAIDAERPLALDDVLTEIAPPDSRPQTMVRAIALHEAAHSVISLRCGLELFSVTVREQGDANGMTRIRDVDDLSGRAGLERHVVGMLAGRAADTLLGHGAHLGAAADLRMATRLLAGLHGSLGLGDAGLVARAPFEEALILVRHDGQISRLVEADLSRLMRQAEAMVVANRAAIEAVADALIARRVLTGAEVRAVMDAHPARMRVKARRATVESC